MLSRMFCPDFPVPVGVLRAVARPTHDQLIEEQIDGGGRAERGQGDLEELLNGGETWTVE